MTDDSLNDTMARRAIIRYGFDELFFDDDNGARQDAGSRGEKSSTPSSRVGWRTTAMTMNTRINTRKRVVG